MTNKKRSPVLAVTLSICTAGLGQMYNGQLLKAIMFSLFGYLTTSFFSITHLLHSFRGFTVDLSIEICWWLFVIGDSLYVSIKEREIQLKSYNKRSFYILFFLVSLLVNVITEYGIVKEIVGLDHFQVPAVKSMNPTLMAGDYAYMDTRYYKTNKPQRNDIIVFKNPEDRSIYSISRIIATEGDSIQIINKKIFINGKEYTDSHGIFNDPVIYPSSTIQRDNLGPVIISQDSIFVMGDNRDMSVDSRFLGQLNKSDIVGKVLYVYWSWDKGNMTVRWRRIGSEFKE